MDDVRINKLFGFGVKIYPYSLVWKKGVTYEEPARSVLGW